MRRFVVFALLPRNIDALAAKLLYAIGALLQSSTKKTRIGLQENKSGTAQTVILILSSSNQQATQVEEKCHIHV